MLLTGIFAPVTTPFYPDGTVYLRKLEHNVDRYCRSPLAGLVVLGSTGEPVMLSDEERREALRLAAQVAAPEKVLIAGTGAESVRETLALGEHAAALSYDAVLVRTPHYYKPHLRPENILTYYRSVADRSPLPVILYSVPVFTGYDLPLEVVCELAEHPNIIGIKESGGNVEKIRQMAQATAHIRRDVAVTEVFEAVTARMLSAAPVTAEKMVGVEALAGSPVAGSASAAVKPKFKSRTKNAGFQILAGSAHLLLPSLAA